MTTNVKINDGKIQFEDKFERIIDKKVTKYGTGAKVDCPKEFIGRKVYLLIRPE